MQTQEQKNILNVYKYNNKNYLTGSSLLMIGNQEYILSENTNMLYETPQFVIDDLYYNMPNLDVEYLNLNQEQLILICPIPYESQDYIMNERTSTIRYTLLNNNRLIKKKCHEK